MAKKKGGDTPAWKNTPSYNNVNAPVPLHEHPNMPSTNYNNQVEWKPGTEGGKESGRGPKWGHVQDPSGTIKPPTGSNPGAEKK